jgi:indole-3-glycerol phosphate synthase
MASGRSGHGFSTVEASRLPGTVATYLDRILVAHRAAADADGRAVDDLMEAARRMPLARGFRARLAARPSGDRIAVIAEVKRRSPSKGDLAPDLVPGVLAKSYADGGASCLSVLTDAEFFGGSAADLAEARASVDLPVLRKDFTVSEADVCDARIMGADAVLLIAAALSDGELRRFSALAAELGLDALVEIHDEAELERAMSVGATLVGVNQRDLVTFQVDHERAERMGTAIPGTVVKVAESGVRDADDARRLADAGYDAVLVGETLVRAPDPSAMVRALRCS